MVKNFTETCEGRRNKLPIRRTPLNCVEPEVPKSTENKRTVSKEEGRSNVVERGMMNTFEED
ncbi:hypothetical protein YC2023_008122 [Brassica napus]